MYIYLLNLFISNIKSGQNCPKTNPKKVDKIVQKQIQKKSGQNCPKTNPNKKWTILVEFNYTAINN
jgi:hypothetical protein